MVGRRPETLSHAIAAFSQVAARQRRHQKSQPGRPSSRREPASGSAGGACPLAVFVPVLRLGIRLAARLVHLRGSAGARGGGADAGSARIRLAGLHGPGVRLDPPWFCATHTRAGWLIGSRRRHAAAAGAVRAVGLGHAAHPAERSNRCRRTHDGAFGGAFYRLPGHRGGAVAAGAQPQPGPRAGRNPRPALSADPAGGHGHPETRATAEALCAGPGGSGLPVLSGPDPAGCFQDPGVWRARHQRAGNPGPARGLDHPRQHAGSEHHHLCLAADRGRLCHGADPPTAFCGRRRPAVGGHRADLWAHHVCGRADLLSIAGVVAEPKEAAPAAAAAGACGGSGLGVGGLLQTRLLCRRCLPPDQHWRRDRPWLFGAMALLGSRSDAAAHSGPTPGRPGPGRRLQGLRRLYAAP